MSSLKKYFSGLSVNIFLLAVASLFADISTEMLYPVLPIFLTQTLGASASVVGIVEGIAQAMQNIVQGFSGWLSDKLQRPKPIAVIGYALAAISKPLIGLSTSWTGVLGARLLDRLGSGTRSAPRDALIASSVEDAHRGKAFGFEGIGDNLGACLGPLLAIALLSLLHVSLRSIFLLAVIPGSLAALMVVFVRAKPAVASSKAKLDLNVGRFPKSYWKYLLVTALFGIGNSSNSFLILRTKDLGASLTMTIFIYALFNLVAALASYPSGYLSDKLGRKGVLLLAFLVFFAVYAGFGLTTNVVLIGILFVLYGLFQGISRSVGKAFAMDFVPAELRASGVGWYTATIGLTGLIASIVGGQLWTRIGPPATFLFGAGSALAGSIALVLLVPQRRRNDGAALVSQ
jgi:MFS family permease